MIRAANQLKNSVSKRLSSDSRTTNQDLIANNPTFDAFDDTCRAALNNGTTVQWGRCKLMLIGHGRAGKTQTLRNLRGLAFQEGDEASPSTPGGAIEHVVVDRTALDSRFNKMEDESKVSELLARASLTQPAGLANPAIGVSNSSNVNIVQDAKKLSQQAKVNIKQGKVKGKAKQQRRSNKGKTTASSARTRAPSVVKEDAPRRVDADFNMSKSSTEGQTPVSFTVWDCGGQDVFNAVHHMFLSSYAVYVLVFNVSHLLDPSTRDEEIETLTFWLNSVRLHAPEARLIVVGTYADTMKNPDQDTKAISLLLEELRYTFGDRWLLNEVAGTSPLLFFPLDNTCAGEGEDGADVARLRRTIVEQAQQLDFVTRKVPVTWPLLLDDLLRKPTKNPETNWRISISEFYNKAKALVGMNEEEASDLLAYWHKLGMLLHYRSTAVLDNWVIIDPQRFVDGITQVIHHRELHDTKEARDARVRANLNPAYNTMMESGIATPELLRCIWSEYGDEEYKFLCDLMTSSMLMSAWRDEDNKTRYFVPSLVTTEVALNDGYGRSKDAQANLDTTVAMAALDFSSFYLPDGLFQRLVGVCVTHSNSDQFVSYDPELGQSTALVWFGDCAVSLRCLKADQRIVLGFSIATAFGDHAAAPNHLSSIQVLLEVIRGEVMGGERLKFVVLLRCPETRSWVRDADLARAQKVNQQSVRITAHDKAKRGFVSVDTMMAVWKPTSTLLVKKQSRLDKVKLLKGDEIKYACFLSHKQSDGNHAVGRVQLLLKDVGYTCWLDQNADDLTKEGMLDGIEMSACFLLYITQNVFESEYVCKVEIAHAMKMNKPFIFLRECDEKVAGFVTFDDAREKAIRAEEKGMLPIGFTDMMSAEEVLDFRTRQHFLNGLMKRIGGMLDRQLKA